MTTFMQHRRATTKSGLVFLPDSAGSNLSVFPGIRPISIHPKCWTPLIGVLLIVGFVSFPVNCALASGPHSIFVDQSRDSWDEAHAHHRQATTGEPQFVHDSGIGLQIEDLPEPTTVLSAISAVVPQAPVNEETVSDTIPDQESPLLIELPFTPESPPPRMVTEASLSF